jgi:xylulokinase
MIRSVMEGVSYSLLDAMSVIREMGVDTSEVRASGGGGRSRLWRQMQADMFDAPVCVVQSSEGPALGAALIAGVGAGVYASVPEACDAAVRRGEFLWPDVRNVQTYAKLYPVYRALYRQLKPSYGALAEALGEIRRP